MHPSQLPPAYDALDRLASFLEDVAHKPMGDKAPEQPTLNKHSDRLVDLLLAGRGANASEVLQLRRNISSKLFSMYSKATRREEVLHAQDVATGVPTTVSVKETKKRKGGA